MGSVWKELRRRNVVRVTVAYIIVSWLLLQVADTLIPALLLPSWFRSAVAVTLILGLPIAVIFAWAFELTPGGLKKEKDLDSDRSITQFTGRNIDFIIIGLLVTALGYLVYDKFILDPSRDAATIQAAATTIISAESQGIDKSIAVLPFVDLSENSDNEYFSDGLSEELLNLLAKVPELRVSARTSSFTFKNSGLTIPEIAKALTVAHALEGSVAKDGDNIRVRVQLVRADDGFQLWSETYSRTLDNIFQIQDEIAKAVVDALKITLLGTAPKARVTDPEAYSLYLEGQYYGYKRTEESLAKSIDLFRQALVIDPEYTPARVELALSYGWYAGIGTGTLSIEDAYAKADRAIEIAIKQDPDYAWTYFVRGRSRIFNRFNFVAGVEDYEHAFQLDPENALIIAALGTGDRVLGRFDEAIEHYMAALELDPVMAEILNSLGTAYLYSGRLDDAETSYRKALSVSSGFAGARFRLGRVLISQGRHAEAFAEMRKEGNSLYQNAGLAMVHHVLGNHEESDRAHDDLIIDNADTAAFQIAEVYSFRGDPDKAFQWLEKSSEVKDSGLAFVLGDPAFRSLIGDPRWQAFLDKLDLLDAWRAMPPEHAGPAP